MNRKRHRRIVFHIDHRQGIERLKREGSIREHCGGENGRHQRPALEEGSSTDHPVIGDVRRCGRVINSGGCSNGCLATARRIPGKSESRHEGFQCRIAEQRVAEGVRGIGDIPKVRRLVVDFADIGSFKSTITDWFANRSIDILINNTNGPVAGGVLDKTVDE